MKFLIVIGGATATGKTTLAIQLARQFQTEILSADSRQFYREMSIGTAKPSPEELRSAKHHFIDSLDLGVHFSAGDFERDALEVLENIFQHQNTAILVGGSGLFIQALCSGLDYFPAISTATHDWVTAGERKGGLDWLQQQLSTADPAYFKTVDRNNPARLRRALEVCMESGQPYSAFLNRQKPQRPFKPVYILLELPREELYRRIDERVDRMIAAGLEEEVRRLQPFQHLAAMRTVGYAEWLPFFQGKIARDEVIDKIKQHSRNFAKRQMTWFKKHGEWKPFHPENTAGIIHYIKQQISS